MDDEDDDDIYAPDSKAASSGTFNASIGGQAQPSNFGTDAVADEESGEELEDESDSVSHFLCKPFSRLLIISRI